MKKILFALVLFLVTSCISNEVHKYQIVYNIYYPNGEVRKVLDTYEGSIPKLYSYRGTNYIRYETSKGLQIDLISTTAPLEIVGYRIINE